MPFTGLKIHDNQTAWECVEKLHSFGPKQICITSTLMTENNGQYMIGFLSDRTGLKPLKAKMKIPIIKDARCVTLDNPDGVVMFTGTGDMFAACLCGHSSMYTLYIQNHFIKTYSSNYGVS